MSNRVRRHYTFIKGVFSMSKFNIGDYVKIREWDDMEREFGLNDSGHIDCKFLFIKEMRRLCGQKFTIKDISNGRYFFKETLGMMCAISEDMLEPFIEEIDEREAECLLADLTDILRSV